MALEKTTTSLYVVQRLAVRSSAYSDEVSLYPDQSEPNEASAVPLAGLRTQEQAEALAARLEAEARRASPIEPYLRTFLPEKVNAVEAAARKAGLTPPDLSGLGKAVGPEQVIRGGVVVGQSYGKAYFAYSKKVRELMSAWWRERAEAVTPEQNAAMWDELFAEPCFYAVQRVLIGE